jgi:hypothetical protein
VGNAQENAMTNPIKSFVVRGPVRGLISRHRTESAAHRSAAKDQRQCRSLGGGAYSDAKVYAVHADGAMTGPYPAPE